MKAPRSRADPDPAELEREGGADISGRTDFRDRVLAAVRRVPAGRVTSYGAVAAAAGRPRAARAVGAALRGLPEGSRVPWWRVVAVDGRVTIPRHHHHDALQRALLEDEGVRVVHGKVDMARFRWTDGVDPDEETARTPGRGR